MIKVNWEFLARRMNWFYRATVVCMIIVGIFLLVDDLRAPTGLEVLVPRGALIWAFLWLMVVPAAGNLVNSFLGAGCRPLRWSLVMLNAGLMAFGVFEAGRSGVEPDTFFVLSILLLVLTLSLFLAWLWDVASREKPGSATFT